MRFLGRESSGIDQSVQHSLDSHWLPGGPSTLGRWPSDSKLLFALQTLDSAQAVKPLVKLIQDGKVAKDQEESVLTLLAALGGPPELGLVLDRALAKDGNTVGKQTAFCFS